MQESGGPAAPHRVTSRIARALGGRRRRAEAEQSACPTPGPRLGPLSALAISLWFGLATGLSELGLTLVQKPLHDPSPGFFRMNRQIVWTIPTFNLALFGLVGLLLALTVKVRPLRSVRLCAGTLGMLSIATLLLSCRRLHPLACLILASGLDYRVIVRIERDLSSFRRLVRWSLPPLAAGMITLVCCSLGVQMLREREAIASLAPVPANGPNAPNVLLVVLDTVRADRLSPYGYGRDTTPNLARLARKGIKFTQARSTASWTLPSHASMMTGRWPHQNSARLHGPLDESHPTLARFLADNGYATAGFVANTTYCGAETGLARGFAHYEDHDLSLMGIVRTSALGQRVLWKGLVTGSGWAGGRLLAEPHKDASRIGGELLAWVDRRDRRPFFAFLNFIDAHSPYVPPSGFERHFGVKPETPADIVTLDRWFTLDKQALPARDLQLASDAYDDCLAYLDEQLGRLFDGLDRRDLLENTLVVITADHGESFGEHGLFCHASSLYDPEIHVPLIAILPGGDHADAVVDAPVSLRDLPATITGLIGLGETSPFPGRSLARHWDRAAPGEAEPTLAEIDGPPTSTPNLGRSPAIRGPMKALVLGRDVYIRSGEGIEELYDLAADPAQSRNLIDAPAVHPRLGTLRDTLDRLTSDDSRPRAWRNTTSAHRQLGKVISPAKVAR
jgi:arylsulfatase A-like enzyme